MRMTINRRSFLGHAALASGISLATPLEAFARLTVRDRTALQDGYGPLAPVADEATGLPLLMLPAGFRYISGGWTGDPLEDQRRTPGAHDGMAAFAASNGRVRIARNHEVLNGPTFAPALTYDTAAGGGTTSLEFDPAAGKWLSARASLAGTARNCAGGPTPWGSWLTCEETLVEPGPGSLFLRPHGYVFEVPVETAASCVPLVSMGRFVHEAVAIDPATGIIYETEDQRASGLYRFTPKARQALGDGGTLEMLAVRGKPKFDTRTQQRVGVEYPVSWVAIEHPDRPHESAGKEDGRGVFAQGLERGGAVFARLEGAWFGAGKVFVTATTGGDAGRGQVWELDPAVNRLRLVFESSGVEVLNMPDNICVSPRGGLVLCEDPDGMANPSVHGLTTEGRLFRFARNNVVLNGETRGITGDFRAYELAGATFSPDGRWLFLNIQTPGLTVAITGPWERGLL